MNESSCHCGPQSRLQHFWSSIICGNLIYVKCCANKWRMNDLHSYQGCNCISASWSVKGMRFLILKEIHDHKIDWLQKYFLADYLTIFHVVKLKTQTWKVLIKHHKLIALIRPWLLLQVYWNFSPSEEVLVLHRSYTYTGDSAANLCGWTDWLIHHWHDGAFILLQKKEKLGIH